MARKTAKAEKVLLPAHIKPDRYELMIKPDLEGFTFLGEEEIFLNVAKPSREITLHAKDLKIESAEFVHKNKEVWAGEIVYDEKSETASIIFKKLIPKGEGRLKLKFTGLLNDKMRGFYRSKYTINGQEKYLATTQFEPTDARRAFPCFDEPGQKAVFDVTLMIPGNATAISNTIEQSIIEHESGYKVVKFKPTPKMSTYLLAFVVGDFEYIEKKTKRGVFVRVFTTPGKKHQAQFALEVAIRCLDFYEKYFGIKYPLPVLDLIAIPDFEAAAMENWGAITYRESAILFDPEQSSASNKQWVATVIAHELAHQWFGNLVTMHWWTDLWLNEGFAAYMENWVLEQLYPEWEMEKQSVTHRLSEALHLDALKNTHPIEVEVHHPDEIDEIFDSISYSKGASVIRMLANYLGEKTFRDGLRYYLNRHKFGNALTTDLWSAFEKVSKKPIRKMMQTWTKKEGYPVVSIRELEVNNHIHTVELKQQRFYSSSVSRASAYDKTVWPIPIQVITNKPKSLVTSFFDKKTAKLALPRQVEWLKLNFDEAALYRTQYSQKLLEVLGPAIGSGKLNPVNRLGPIRDAFALAESGLIATTHALELAGFYKNENDLAVWTEIVTGLAQIYQWATHEPWFENFAAYARELLKKIAYDVGWEKKIGENHTTGLLRSVILNQFGVYGDQATIQRARKYFEQAGAGKPVPADLRGVVYNLAAEFGGQKEFNQIVKMYQETELHEEQDRLGRAMSRFRDVTVQNQVLEFTLSNTVRIQDAPFIWVRMLNNPYARKTAWVFIKRQWPKLLEMFGASRMLGRLAGHVGMFNTQAEYTEVKKFFASHPVPAGKRAVQQALESISSNIEWRKRDSKKIGEWLNKFKDLPHISIA